MPAHQSRDVRVSLICSSFRRFLGWNESKGLEGYMGSYYKLIVWRVARSFLRLRMSIKHDLKSEFGCHSSKLVTDVIMGLDFGRLTCGFWGRWPVTTPFLDSSNQTGSARLTECHPLKMKNFTSPVDLKPPVNLAGMADFVGNPCRSPDYGTAPHKLRQLLPMMITLQPFIFAINSLLPP